MDSDREEYYQAKMALAIKLTKDTVYNEVIVWNVEQYNKIKDIRNIRSINALMRVVVGSDWFKGKCGINQHGVWVK